MNLDSWVNCRCMPAFILVGIIFRCEFGITILSFTLYAVLIVELHYVPHIFYFAGGYPTGLVNYKCCGRFIEVLPSLEAGLILEQAHVCVSFHLMHFTHPVRQMNVCRGLSVLTTKYRPAKYDQLLFSS